MLKSFDFFRKIQTDQELTSTTGGIFTLISLIVSYPSSQIAGILIVMSLQDFYQEKYYTFLAIKNDNSEYLPMRIDITFNKLPCHGISWFKKLSALSFTMSSNTGNPILRTKSLSLTYPKTLPPDKSINEAEIEWQRKTFSHVISKKVINVEFKEF